MPGPAHAYSHRASSNGPATHTSSHQYGHRCSARGRRRHARRRGGRRRAREAARDGVEAEHAADGAVDEALVDVLDEHYLRVRLEREPRGHGHRLEHLGVRARVARGVREDRAGERGEPRCVGALDLGAERVELGGEDAGGEGWKGAGEGGEHGLRGGGDGPFPELVEELDEFWYAVRVSNALSMLAREGRTGIFLSVNLR